MSRRTIERALAWLRENDSTFKFSTRRVGRSYAVRVSDRQISPPFPPHPLSPHGDSFGIKGNTAGRVSGQAAKISTQGAQRLNRFAGFIARRDLAPLHWDNCKVLFRFAHGFNYAAAALTRGFGKAEIIQAYEASLIQRHKDATDKGLNRGDPSAKFEPSSTVSLAATLLADGRTDAERRRRRFEILAPVKAANERLAAEIRAEMAAPSFP